MKILDIQKSKDMKYLLQKLSMFTFSCTKIESNATEKKEKHSFHHLLVNWLVTTQNFNRAASSIWKFLPVATYCLRTSSLTIFF